jgi:Rrf2 family iron-sulfur cluster assembly transcriptional regulator
MRLSIKTAYSLHALMYMVRHATQLPVSGGAIAKAEAIPTTTLSKLLQDLAKAGFVKAERGRHKGYVFARPPQDITLLEVLELTEGEDLFGECPLKHCVCGGTPTTCQIYGQWHGLSQRMAKIFGQDVSGCGCLEPSGAPLS